MKKTNWRKEKYNELFECFEDNNCAIIKSFTELINKCSDDSSEFHIENPISLKKEIIANSLRVLVSNLLKQQREKIEKDIINSPYSQAPIDIENNKWISCSSCGSKSFVCKKCLIQKINYIKQYYERL